MSFGTPILGSFISPPANERSYCVWDKLERDCVLDCASQLALWNERFPHQKRQRTAAVQNLADLRHDHLQVRSPHAALLGGFGSPYGRRLRLSKSGFWKNPEPAVLFNRLSR